MVSVPSDLSQAQLAVLLPGQGQAYVICEATSCNELPTRSSKSHGDRDSDDKTGDDDGKGNAADADTDAGDSNAADADNTETTGN